MEAAFYDLSSALAYLGTAKVLGGDLVGHQDSLGRKLSLTDSLPHICSSAANVGPYLSENIFLMFMVTS